MGMIRGPQAAALYNAINSASSTAASTVWGFLGMGTRVPPEAVALTSYFINEAAVWGIDASVLLDSLRLEGLGFLEDLLIPGAMNLKSDQPIAEVWERRINNMGALHNQFSREHVVGPMVPFDKLALWFAKDDEMKHKLLEHYIWGQGAPRNLTHREMHAMVTYIDLFQTGYYSATLDDAIQDAVGGQSVAVKTEVYGANNALGNFSIELKGTLKPFSGVPAGPTSTPYFVDKKLADPGASLVFEGEMKWRDFWDFDAKVADTLRKKSGRGLGGEAAVNLVAALVDGVPFDVTSVKIPVTQYSGHAAIY